MSQKILGAQRDFSAGEIDPALKRADDHPFRKAGLRQMSNWRILNSKGIQNRPGRTALFANADQARTEEVKMSSDAVFKLVFRAGKLDIVDSTGAVAQSFTTKGGGGALPWAADTLASIVYAVFNLAVYITFPGMRPQVVAWDGTATWIISDFNETLIGNQKRTPFYRLSPKGVKIRPAAQTGTNISVFSDTAIFTPAHVGTRIRFVNRQMLITEVNPAGNSLAVDIEESLPGSQVINFDVDPASTYSIGDAVTGTVTGSTGIVSALNAASSNSITVQLLTNNSSTRQATNNYVPVTYIVAFTVDDTVVGPGGGLKPNAAGAIDSPVDCEFWDDEVMNDMRGYPESCFVDQFRLGFCDFPALRGGIGWSAINNPTDLYVDAQPSNAIFEIIPDKGRVYHVVPGAESSEFVFCDTKVYYIKIDPSSPLKPGSVSFQTLSSDGAANVQPRAAQNALFYVNAGGNSVMCVVATGAYYRPFNAKNITEFHSHLFSSIAALAAPNADGSFNERYVYAMNSNGSVVVGKYDISDGNLALTIGWGPWSGVGTVEWVSARAGNVLFSTSYFGQRICEMLDDGVYLDCAIPVNDVPTALAPPVGKGPLWLFPNQTVTLMDQVTRSLGTYDIDANGNIVPQFNGGEDLTAASLIAGQQWTGIAEPFCPSAPGGTDAGQRIMKRRVTRFCANVMNSTGFLMARLFSGPITPTSPALGAVKNSHRVPAWNQGDDPTQAPPLREEEQRWSPLGFSHDPRVAIIKDTPGPLLIAELDLEATL